MKLSFPGTRGEIDVRTRLHRMHSCLLVQRRVLVDCGADLLGKLEALAPQAILLTHAHPDHAGGLRDGAPCEVYATPATWQRLRHYSIERRRIIRPRQPQIICGITFEAFSVEHSLLAPAVGFRITSHETSVFYVPDLVSIRQRHDALSRIAAYIGDGAKITRPLIRRRGTRTIGHTSVRVQLNWCGAEHVPCVVVTHCGSEIVKADAAAVSARIRTLGEERGVDVIVAYDGMELTLDCPAA